MLSLTSKSGLPTEEEIKDARRRPTVRGAVIQANLTIVEVEVRNSRWQVWVAKQGFITSSLRPPFFQWNPTQRVGYVLSRTDKDPAKVLGAILQAVEAGENAGSFTSFITPEFRDYVAKKRGIKELARKEAAEATVAAIAAAVVPEPALIRAAEREVDQAAAAAALSAAADASTPGEAAALVEDAVADALETADIAGAPERTEQDVPVSCIEAAVAVQGGGGGKEAEECISDIGIPSGSRDRGDEGKPPPVKRSRIQEPSPTPEEQMEMYISLFDQDATDAEEKASLVGELKIRGTPIAAATEEQFTLDPFARRRYRFIEKVLLADVERKKMGVFSEVDRAKRAVRLAAQKDIKNGPGSQETGDAVQFYTEKVSETFFELEKAIQRASEAALLFDVQSAEVWAPLYNDPIRSRPPPPGFFDTSTRPFELLAAPLLQPTSYPTGSPAEMRKSFAGLATAWVRATERIIQMTTALPQAEQAMPSRPSFLLLLNRCALVDAAMIYVRNQEQAIRDRILETAKLGGDLHAAYMSWAATLSSRIFTEIAPRVLDLENSVADFASAAPRVLAQVATEIGEWENFLPPPEQDPEATPVDDFVSDLRVGWELVSLYERLRTMVVFPGGPAEDGVLVKRIRDRCASTAEIVDREARKTSTGALATLRNGRIFTNVGIYSGGLVSVWTGVAKEISMRARDGEFIPGGAGVLAEIILARNLEGRLAYVGRIGDVAFASRRFGDALPMFGGGDSVKTAAIGPGVIYRGGATTIGGALAAVGDSGDVYVRIGDVVAFRDVFKETHKIQSPELYAEDHIDSVIPALTQTVLTGPARAVWRKINAGETDPKSEVADILADKVYDPEDAFSAVVKDGRVVIGEITASQISDISRCIQEWADRMVASVETTDYENREKTQFIAGGALVLTEVSDDDSPLAEEEEEEEEEEAEEEGMLGIYAVAAERVEQVVGSQLWAAVLGRVGDLYPSIPPEKLDVLARVIASEGADRIKAPEWFIRALGYDIGQRLIREFTGEEGLSEEEEDSEED